MFLSFLFFFNRQLFYSFPWRNIDIRSQNPKTVASKVALISSRMGSISDNGSGASYGYRMSKAALNAAGMSLANDLKHRGIAVGLLHPGFVKTTLVDNQGDIDTTEAARRLEQRIEELTLDITGSFRHSNGQTLPW